MRLFTSILMAALVIAGQSAFSQAKKTSEEILKQFSMRLLDYLIENVGISVIESTFTNCQLTDEFEILLRVLGASVENSDAPYPKFSRLKTVLSLLKSEISSSDLNFNLFGVQNLRK